MASLVKRRNTYYLQDRFGGRIKRTSLRTDSLQIAKEKLRQYESAKLRGLDSPLPTRTPIGQVVEAYVKHIRTVKTAKSAQTDIYYLREAFGPCCDAVQITSRRPSAKARKRPPTPGRDGRCREHHIEPKYFEAITTADVQQFIDGRVRSRGLAPKTANRYREILCRLFNWSMKQGLIRMPGQVNPVLNVERHKEKAPEIRFLTLAQIDEQLLSLRFKPQLQTMVATLIYAGLRREELLWLTHDDIDLSRRNGGHGLIRIRAKTINGRFWQPKTKRNRAVPISKALRGYLDQYNAPASDQGWYFPSPMGLWWDCDGFSQALRQVNSEAGFTWSCLDFRHTFGSQLAQTGITLFKIATLMGNSPEICRRHYASLLPEHLHGDVDFIISNCRSISICGM
jgi:integrase